MRLFAMHSKLKGFTLIEIMAVIVIIGIVAAVIMLRPQSAADKLTFEAKRLLQVLRLAQEEAIVHGVELGVQLSERHYAIVRLDKGNWSALSQDKAFQNHVLPEGIVLVWDVEGMTLPIAPQAAKEQAQEIDARSQNAPQILVLSSGEVNPFALVIGVPSTNEESEDTYYVIRGRFDGHLAIEGPLNGNLYHDAKLLPNETSSR